jgi:hypothetical protein
MKPSSTVSKYSLLISSVGLELLLSLRVGQVLQGLSIDCRLFISLADRRILRLFQNHISVLPLMPDYDTTGKVILGKPCGR